MNAENWSPPCHARALLPAADALAELFDVEQFPGHIACDAGSRSEIVLPIVSGGRVVAVLDLDSYELAAFDDVDAEYLAKVAELASTFAW